MSWWRRDSGARKPEQPDESLGPVMTAEALIGSGDHVRAEALLDAYVATVPPGWSAVEESASEIIVRSWDIEEFLAYAAAHRGAGKRITWQAGSYSKAWYLLAYIAVERKEYRLALQRLQQGMRLEEDHPLLLCEIGLAFRKLKDFPRAIRAYQAAIGSTKATRGTGLVALRGFAGTLFEAGELELAERVLKLILADAPDDPVALHELRVLEQLRAGRLTA